MQTLVQVICTKGDSMREKIFNSKQIDNSHFKVVEIKRRSRSNGWTKLHSTLPDRDGAINIEWDSDTNVLICRVVTKGKGKPDLIIGDFVGFMLHNFKKRIVVINIIIP